MTNEGKTEQDAILQIDNWSSWHDEYANSDSELNARKRAVQNQVAAIVEQCPPGPVTVVSICGGQGRELIGAVENHARRADVRGRIVELDPENSAFARAWARKAGLDNLEVVTGDASLSASFAGLPPVDIVVISGVFGHIDVADQKLLVSFLRQICRKGGYVVWTFFSRGEERTNSLRGIFREQEFVEESFETLSGKFGFTIARSCYAGTTVPFELDSKFFTFGSSRAGRQEAES